MSEDYIPESSRLEEWAYEHESVLSFIRTVCLVVVAAVVVAAYLGV